jgi:hypothetical protein
MGKSSSWVHRRIFHWFCVRMQVSELCPLVRRLELRAFVSWLQYAMLAAALSAPAKGAIVFLAALALIWCTAALLRRVPAIARVI